mgnify:CR=1 FL=1
MFLEFSNLKNKEGKMKKIASLTPLFISLLFSEVLTLKNGIPFIYKKTEGIDVFSIGVLFKGGSAKYEEGTDGIELFSLNAILEGTKKYPYPELQKIMTREGIRKRVESDYDYSVLILKSPIKNFKRTIDIIFEVFKAPELNPDRVKIVKNKLIADAKKREENPDTKLFDLLNKVFYKNHPYLIDPAGKTNTLEKFGIEDIKKFLEENFHAKGIVIGLTGPLEKTEILNLLNETFGNLPEKEFKIKEIPDFSPKDTFFSFKEPNYKTSYMACKFPLPSLTHKDYPAILALSEILSTRFEEKVRTEMGLSYSVFAGSSMRKRNYGYFYVSSSFPDSAWKIMLEEVEKIKKEGAKEKEIKETLNLWRTVRYLQNASTDGALIALLRSYILTGNPDYIDSIISQVEEVKPKDIKRCAIQYLKNYTTIKISP